MSEGVFSEANCKVALRIRPLSAQERICATEEWCIVDSNLRSVHVTTLQGSTFHFDYVYPPHSSQRDVYTCTKPLVSAFLEGYNASLLVYGQTGAGKTYTIGCEGFVQSCDDDAGLIPRACFEIFAALDRRGREQTLEGRMFEAQISCSFMELYNEEIRDLLDGGSFSTANRTLTIRRDPETGEMKVQGLRVESCSSAEDMLSCLNRGSLRRTTGSTKMNLNSSRSHAIFTIRLIQRFLQRPCDATDDEMPRCAHSDWKHSSFHFVDLAGSERAKKTRAEGHRLKEGIRINEGLSILGRVINALTTEGKQAKHIPYRDSKLTRILQDSLGGNSRTLMLACISPAAGDLSESYNTLLYAARARRIRNRPVINKEHSNAALVEELRKEIETLKKQLAELNHVREKGAAFVVYSDDGTREGLAGANNNGGSDSSVKSSSLRVQGSAVQATGLLQLENKNKILKKEVELLSARIRHLEEKALNQEAALLNAVKAKHYAEAEVVLLARRLASQKGAVLKGIGNATELLRAGVLQDDCVAVSATDEADGQCRFSQNIAFTNTGCLKANNVTQRSELLTALRTYSIRSKDCKEMLLTLNQEQVEWRKLLSEMESSLEGFPTDKCTGCRRQEDLNSDCKLMEMTSASCVSFFSENVSPSKKPCAAECEAYTQLQADVALVREKIKCNELEAERLRERVAELERRSEETGQQLLELDTKLREEGNGTMYKTSEMHEPRSASRENVGILHCRDMHRGGAHEWQDALSGLFRHTDSPAESLLERLTLLFTDVARSIAGAESLSQQVAEAASVEVDLTSACDEMRSQLRSKELKAVRGGVEAEEVRSMKEATEAAELRLLVQKELASFLEARASRVEAFSSASVQSLIKSHSSVISEACFAAAVNAFKELRGAFEEMAETQRRLEKTRKELMASNFDRVVAERKHFETLFSLHRSAHRDRLFRFNLGSRNRGSPAMLWSDRACISQPSSPSPLPLSRCDAPNALQTERQRRQFDMDPGSAATDVCQKCTIKKRCREFPSVEETSGGRLLSGVAGSHPSSGDAAKAPLESFTDCCFGCSEGVKGNWEGHSELSKELQRTREALQAVVARSQRYQQQLRDLHSQLREAGLAAKHSRKDIPAVQETNMACAAWGAAPKPSSLEKSLATKRAAEPSLMSIDVSWMKHSTATTTTPKQPNDTSTEDALYASVRVSFQEEANAHSYPITALCLDNAENWHTAIDEETAPPPANFYTGSKACIRMWDVGRLQKTWQYCVDSSPKDIPALEVWGLASLLHGKLLVAGIDDWVKTFDVREKPKDGLAWKVAASGPRLLTAVGDDGWRLAVSGGDGFFEEFDIRFGGVTWSVFPRIAGPATALGFLHGIKFASGATASSSTNSCSGLVVASQDSSVRVLRNTWISVIPPCNESPPSALAVLPGKDALQLREGWADDGWLVAAVTDLLHLRVSHVPCNFGSPSLCGSKDFTFADTWTSTEASVEDFRLSGAVCCQASFAHAKGRESIQAAARISTIAPWHAQRAFVTGDEFVDAKPSTMQFQ